jgi:hypothetical protein
MLLLGFLIRRSQARTSKGVGKEFSHVVGVTGAGTTGDARGAESLWGANISERQVPVLPGVVLVRNCRGVLPACDTG